jgi:hypothetical protein
VNLLRIEDKRNASEFARFLENGLYFLCVKRELDFGRSATT